MKKLLRVALLFCLTSSIANAQEMIDLTKGMKCSNAEFVMNHFATQYNESPIWVGKSNTGTHITLLVNKEKRTWTMVEYDASIACVLGAGETSSDPNIGVKLNTY
jgi:hypothetical protein